MSPYFLGDFEVILLFWELLKITLYETSKVLFVSLKEPLGDY
jgi:hypothetical protein